MGPFLHDREGTPVGPRGQPTPSLGRRTELPLPPGNQAHVAVLASEVHSICLESCKGLVQRGFSKRWDLGRNRVETAHPLSHVSPPPLSQIPGCLLQMDGWFSGFGDWRRGVAASLSSLPDCGSASYLWGK